MLKLKNVTKGYEMGDYTVRALRGVTLAFRESEFVSIIGASGCGKSTMLNIIGGLDRYTTGDLIIGNTSTKSFKSEQWDAYRNATIGFVFQNYNLIPHLTVVENVELALSLSGVDKAARRRMATEALERVGMGDELRKKPSQISGGQMQRVAIARALVNNPKIVLADEPTGALDSKLSVQVMELLKEVAKDRLVIMVTHNNELANTYSTRIVKLRDGLVESDSMPFEWEPELVETESETDAIEADAEKASAEVGAKKNNVLVAAVKSLNALGIKAKGQKTPFKSTSMKARTAFSLSLKNLLTKKRRTFLTSFAGSVGIISLALVLAMSNGFNLVLDNMQSSILATVPIGIYEYSMDYSVMTDMFENYQSNTSTYPDEDEIYLNGTASSSGGGMADISGMMSSILESVGRNDISAEFVEYLKAMDPSWTNSINYYYGTKMNILAKTLSDDGIGFVYKDVSSTPKDTTALSIATQVLGENGQEAVNWYQLAGDKDFVLSNYDLIGGTYPAAYNEIVLVVDGNNVVSPEALAQFGVDVYERDENNAVVYDGDSPVYKESMSFDELFAAEIKLIDNDTYYEYVEDGGYYQPRTYGGSSNAPYAGDEVLWEENSNVQLKITGVLRLKSGGTGFVGNALCYTPELAEHVLESAAASEVTAAQKALLAENPNSSTCVVKNDGYFNGQLGKDSEITGVSQIINFFMNGLKRTARLKALAVNIEPVYINIYPKDFASKTQITDYLNAWNDEHGNMEYFDVSEMFIYNMRVMVDLMTTVLIAVASISLIVSCIMIAIITGNSVVERTREIGILRSLGARKKDISRVFDAETAIIGLFSGVLGIAIAYALVPLVNLLLANSVGMSLLALNPLHAALLVVLSLGLTVLSGLVPSQMAARKNVVDALRIE